MYGTKSINTQAIKNLNDAFLTKGPLLKKLSQIVKAPPGGRAESENNFILMVGVLSFQQLDSAFTEISNKM